MKEMTWVFTGLALAGLSSVGCGASEERVQDKFADFVSERDSCDVATDCMVGSYGCPLGCYVAFNKKYEDEVADKSERLIKKYERGGRACEYLCSEPDEVVCEAGRCGVEEPDPE